MSQAARELELDRDDFERALTLLKREQKSLTLSRPQKISYTFYLVFMCGLSISVVGMLASLLFYFKREEPPVVFYLFAFGASLSFLALIPLFFLNLSLLLKAFREKRCLRRIGLSKAPDLIWGVQPKQYRWMTITANTALVVGLLILLGTVSTSVKIDALTWSFHVQPEWEMLGLGLAVAILFVAFYFLQKGKAWLDSMAERSSDVAGVRASMLKVKRTTPRSGDERIAVPVETLERVAQIEAAEIARQRASAICQVSSKPTYSILSSLETLEAKARLDPDSRISVDRAIEELMEQPRPSGVQKDAKTGLLRQRVDGTDWWILYSVDESTRRIRCVSLQNEALAGIDNA